jgi:uroporphyrinogen III methyltransferase/synthase
LTRQPFVYIVGAGPGAPSLISVRGLRCVESADVLVYDHLIHPRLLDAAPPEAERLDVGAALPQPLQQEAIAYLLVEKAREGKVVVRLKWGDPFLFDDGGKEALILGEQQVPFEVVPGIPAAVGVPCYAGVPLSYPGLDDTITLVRGFESEARGAPDVNWRLLAGLGGTLVCYAGARQLPEIVEALLASGRPADEAVALVYQGTLPDQTTIQTSLGQLARAARRSGDRRPAILVVGQVANLREHLRWFDARPLFGRRIVVTRSREQAEELVRMLEDLGADPIEAPTIRILPVEDHGALDAACARAGTYDWIVFTTANGVDAFMRRLVAAGDVRELKGVRLCAIGPATAERLGRFGIRVDLMPVEDRGEAVAEAMARVGDLGGRRVLLPRADTAREMLADELRGAGAVVDEVVTYRTVLAHGDIDVYRMLLEKLVDAVTFTSASSVRNFVNLVGAEPAADLLNTTVVASIGPVTAEAAQQLGIRTTIMPSTYTIPALVEAIVDYFAQKTRASSV